MLTLAGMVCSIHGSPSSLGAAGAMACQPVSPEDSDMGTLTASLPPCRLQEIDALHEKKAANLTKLQEEAQGKKKKKFGFF